MPLSPPEPLADTHALNDFSCGVGSLDDWLKRRARANQVSGASRTFVVADTLGIRGIVVHALSDQAKAFYLALGFDPSPGDPMTLMVTLRDIRHLLA